MLAEANIIYRLLTRKPVFVGFNVTNRCNMRCAFCSVPYTRQRDMTLPEVGHALDRLAEIGIPVVGVTGGEPFLREDLAGIVRAIQDRGMKCTIVTNGELLTRERMRQLRFARNVVHFALSVDTLDLPTYARLRGHRSLPETLARYLDLRAEGPATTYKLNVVLGPDNADELDSFLEFARATDLALSFIPMNIGPGGLHRGNEYPGLTPAARHKVAGAFQRLYQWKLEGKPLWDHRDFYRLAIRYLQGDGMGPCHAGRLFLDLRSDGGLALCNEMDHFMSLLDVDRLRLADIEAARREWQPRIDACRTDGACCYTCSYNITATAQNIPAYVWDYLRLQWL